MSLNMAMSLRNNPFRDNSLSEDQKLIVTNILNKKLIENNLPFLILGPFGSGKTRCIIETVYQLCLNQKNSKILVCSPSESSSDVLGESIAEYLNPSQMFRLYSFHHPHSSVPKKLLPYSYYMQDKQIFYLPNSDTLLQYQVFVSTSMTAAMLYSVDLSGFFTHIFIDQAAMMSEVEALIPISLANPATSVVLSGDEQEYGPLLQGVPVKQYGLTKSILERLTNNTYLRSQGTDAVIQLSTNYKTHPDIVRYVSSLSEQFYDNNIQSLASPPAPTWPRLVNKKFRMFFYGIKGVDLREGDSPSFFNLYEVVAVVEMIESLIESGANANDIGVITPFYKQVQKNQTTLQTQKSK